MLDRIRSHPILAICGILGTLTVGAGAIVQWTDYSFNLWASAAEVKILKAESKVAAGDRKTLHYNIWKDRAKDTRQQIYQNSAEERKYKRHKEPVPEEVYKQREFLKQQYDDQILKRNSYK